MKNRIISTVLVVAGLAAFAAPALAQGPERTSVAAARQVMVCGRDTATRRAFAREFGSDPVFITADDAVRAQGDGQAWTAPRCMTEAEHARLTRLLSQRASL